MATTPQRKRLLTIAFGLSVVMLAATTGILIAYGPSTTNVLNIVVSICNVTVFALTRRDARGPTE